MSNPFNKQSNKVVIIRPMRYKDVHYGIDLFDHIDNPEHYKLIRYEPKTLEHIQDRIWFGDKAEEIFICNKLERILDAEINIRTGMDSKGWNKNTSQARAIPFGK